MAEQLLVQFQGVSPLQASQLAQELQQWIDQRSAGQPISARVERSNPNAQSAGDGVLIELVMETGKFLLSASEHAVALTVAHLLCDMLKGFLTTKGVSILGGHAAAAVVISNTATGKAVHVDPAEPESAAAIKALVEDSTPSASA